MGHAHFDLAKERALLPKCVASKGNGDRPKVIRHFLAVSDFTSTDRKLFFSKNDPRDPRLGDLVRHEAEGSDVILIGYPDDEGVKLNGGRVGASFGPHAVRDWLYRTTPHPRKPLKPFADLGNLNINKSSDDRYRCAKAFARHHFELKRQMLCLGGGNDYAYPDGLAFLEAFHKEKPLIINIDAHLDVRDMSFGPTSGTPFFRLLESDIPFQFIELGIQAQCNSTAHWDYVESKGGKIIALEELLDSPSSWIETIVNRLGDSLLRKRPAFLAIDIDAFAFPYAIGSSAAWPIGLDPLKFWPLYQFLLKRLDVRALGIYEVSPPLENGFGTAKLAAQFAHGFLHHV